MHAVHLVIAEQNAFTRECKSMHKSLDELARLYGVEHVGRCATDLRRRGQMRCDEIRKDRSGHRKGCVGSRV
eukprot:5596668-Pleurochrysis_carterae.AAC.1